jgi:hypothetical protein
MRMNSLRLSEAFGEARLNDRLPLPISPARWARAAGFVAGPMLHKQVRDLVSAARRAWVDVVKRRLVPRQALPRLWQGFFAVGADAALRPRQQIAFPTPIGALHAAALGRSRRSEIEDDDAAHAVPLTA